MNYKVITLKDNPGIFEDQDKVSIEGWPEFMLHDPVSRNWMTFINHYLDHQLVLLENENILSIVNTIPLNYKGDIKDLPDEGWDWGVLKGVKDINEKNIPNILMGVQVVVNKTFRGKNLSSISTDEMCKLFREKNYDKLIVPLRPSLKHLYPLISMEEYIMWKNRDGLPFDPWLRIHIRKGAKIVKICNQAMTIRGSSLDWKKWTGLDFKSSGDYIVPGALVPVKYDNEKDVAEYIEPNIWIEYN